MCVACASAHYLLTAENNGQVLLYLLRRCYGLIYRLLSSSEPVSEELMPIVGTASTSLFLTL